MKHTYHVHAIAGLAIALALGVYRVLPVGPALARVRAAPCRPPTCRRPSSAPPSR